MRIGVVGAGSWGTTLADLLAGAGHEVSLWAREPEVVDSIRRERVDHLVVPHRHQSARVRPDFPRVRFPDHDQ